MTADVALLIVGLLFATYAWLCTIEFGVALARLERRAKTDPAPAIRLLTPLMEVTNVFLVFGFTGYSVLFNNALVETSHLVLSTLVAGLIALVIRALLVIELFYRKQKLGPGVKNIAFVIVSALVPLSFGAAGLALLQNQPVWRSPTSLFLFSLLVAIIFTGGLSFKASLEKKNRNQIASGAYPGILLNLAGMIGMSIINFDNAQFRVFPISLLSLTFALGIIVNVAAAWHRHPKWTWLHTSALIFVMPLLLTWANRPFLIHGQITIDQAYGAQAYGPGAVTGLLVMLPIIAVGLGLFLHLLRTDSK